MCLNQKYIVTRSKVLSPYHRERVLIPCKCGKCAECMASLHNEWYYRIYHEWLSTLEQHGYIFFDTLTYSDEYLPHLSDTIDVFKDTRYDFPCFNPEHISLFLSNLRRKLSYHGHDVADKLRYFICSEYGTDARYTHRPHYHLLLFVTTPDLTVYQLRQAVHDAWSKGRTDKVRISGQHSNYFTSKNGQSELAVSNYVAKYVQKVSSFQYEIDKRIDIALRLMFGQNFVHFEPTLFDNFDSFYLDQSYYASLGHGLKIRYRDDEGNWTVKKKVYEDEYHSFCKSETAKKLKRDLMRKVGQNHNQSKGFGLSALRDVDLNELMNTGFLTMPDKKKIVRKIPLPTYYERHLFQELVKTDDGCRIWQPTSLGKLYKRKKESRLVDYLAEKYQALAFQYKVYPDVNFRMLARYIVYFKGRLKGSSLADPTFTEKLNLPDLYCNYSCPSDKALFHAAFVTHEYLGANGQYYSHVCDDSIPINHFIKKKVITDADQEWSKGYDAIINHLDALYHKNSVAKQKLFDQLQEMKNKQKHAKLVQMSLFD